MTSDQANILKALGPEGVEVAMLARLGILNIKNENASHFHIYLSDNCSECGYVCIKDGAVDNISLGSLKRFLSKFHDQKT